jgi:hypothetical protein
MKTSPPARAQSGIVEVVQANAFQLLDEDGNPRAALRMIEGNPVLELYSAGGLARARFGLPEGTPNLQFLDSDGNMRIGAVLSKSEATSLLTLSGPERKLHAAFAAGPDGGSMVLWDSNVNRRVKLYVKEDSMPALEFFDNEGEMFFSAP